MMLRAGLVVAALLAASLPAAAAGPLQSSGGHGMDGIAAAPSKRPVTHGIARTKPAPAARKSAAAGHRQGAPSRRNVPATATLHGTRPSGTPPGAALSSRAGGAGLLPKSAGAAQNRPPSESGHPAHALLPQPNSLGGAAGARPVTVNANHGPAMGQVGGPQRYDAKNGGGISGTGWRPRM